MRPSSGSRPLSSSILAVPPEASFGVTLASLSLPWVRGGARRGLQAGDAALGGCLMEEKGRGAGIGMRKAQDVLVCGEEVFQRRGEVSCRGGVAGSVPSAGGGGRGKGSGSWSRLCLPLPLQWRHTPGWDGGVTGHSEVGFEGCGFGLLEGHPQGTHCPPGELGTAPQGTTGGP